MTRSETHRARTERARKILADLGVTRHGRPATMVQRALVEDWVSMRVQIEELRAKPMSPTARATEARLIALSNKTLERLAATRSHR